MLGDLTCYPPLATLPEAVDAAFSGVPAGGRPVTPPPCLPPFRGRSRHLYAGCCIAQCWPICRPTLRRGSIDRGTKVGAMDAPGESQLRETISGLVVFVLLCASAALGMFVRPRLPEQHRSRETTELMQITIGLLVTFAALVLGLLTASVKQRYDHAAQDRQGYALELTLMDQCLRDYGPGTEAARANIRSYTAAVIASTWPSEAPPEGVTYPDTKAMPRTGASPVLRGIMNQVGMEMIRLAPTDPENVRILPLCMDN